MTFTSVLFSSAVLAFLLQPGLAANNGHAAYLASISTYGPMAGFNYVVGPTRFVGYFLRAPGMCRVVVFEAEADDEALVSPPERVKIDHAPSSQRQ